MKQEIDKDIYDEKKTLRCLALDFFNECWNEDIICQDLDSAKKSSGTQLSLFAFMNPSKKKNTTPRPPPTKKRD